MSIDYDRLRELAEKHSPAPWGVHQDNGELGAYGDTTRFFVADNDYAEIAQGEAVTLEKHRQLQADYELMALAPDMARELLRLRNGIERVLAQMNDHAATLRRLERHNVAFHMEQYSRLLADELNGEPK